MQFRRSLAAMAMCIIAIIMILYVAGRASQKPFLDQDEVGICYDNGEIYVVLSSGESIKTSDIDGVKYAFLPSFCKAVRCETADLGQQVVYGTSDDGNSSFDIEYGSDKALEIISDGVTLFSGEIVFNHSENIYTTFISTGDVSVDDIDRSYINGNIKTVSANGTTPKMSGDILLRARGNSTFFKSKKPYTIKFDKAAQIGSLSPAKKFHLLANAFDGSRMLNKLVLDMMNNAGMEYTPAAEWTDLYINGEYRGNYMICESIDISQYKINTAELQKINEKVEQVSEEKHYEEGNEKGYLYDNKVEDISGGYIVEKDLDEYYAESPCGFITDDDVTFTISYPNNASREEVQYIRSVVQNVENMINTGGEELFSYIDVSSFTKRYLIEELVYNADSTITSYNYYKKKGDPLLYAGPGWDYDGSFGELSCGIRDYNESILNLGELRGKKTIKWDKTLLENEAYYEELLESYLELRPLFISTYETAIDDYADIIRSSAEMDIIRYPYSVNDTLYLDFENTVRYIKFFMYHRILLLDEMFGIDSSDIEPPYTTDEMHTVTITYFGSSSELQALDGDLINEEWFADYATDSDYRWQYKDKNETISFCTPIYEDFEIEYVKVR